MRDRVMVGVTRHVDDGSEKCPFEVAESSSYEKQGGADYFSTATRPIQLSLPHENTKQTCARVELRRLWP